MVPMSTTEKNFAEKTFFVSTFLDSYTIMFIISKKRLVISKKNRILCYSFATHYVL